MFAGEQSGIPRRSWRPRGAISKEHLAARVATQRPSRSLPRLPRPLALPNRTLPHCQTAELFVDDDRSLTCLETKFFRSWYISCADIASESSGIPSSFACRVIALAYPDVYISLHVRSYLSPFQTFMYSLLAYTRVISPLNQSVSFRRACIHVGYGPLYVIHYSVFSLCWSQLTGARLGP